MNKLMKIIGCVGLAILLFTSGIFTGLYFASIAIEQDDFCKNVLEEQRQKAIDTMDDLKEREKQIKEEIKLKQEELKQKEIEVYEQNN